MTKQAECIALSKQIWENLSDLSNQSNGWHRRMAIERTYDLSYALVRCFHIGIARPTAATMNRLLDLDNAVRAELRRK